MENKVIMENDWNTDPINRVWDNDPINRVSISFTKVREVKDPSTSYDSAGLDFYMPNNLKEEDFTNYNGVKFELNLFNEVDKIILAPHGRVLIPSGIKVRIPKLFALIAHNKSGVSSKKGLIFSAQVVDADYTGEVHLGIINTGNEETSIQAGTKVLQFLLVPVFHVTLNAISNEQYATFKSSRGSKGFGSSDRISTMIAGDFPNRPDPLGIMYDTSKSDSD